MSEALTSATLTNLPAAVRDGLDRFTKQLANASGESLSSLVLYGGVARGEYAPNSSDVNVMIVFRGVDVSLLDRIASGWKASSPAKLRNDVIGEPT